MAGLTGLQQMQLLLDGKAPAPPISETLDFALIEVAHGRAIFQGKPSPRLLNPMGTVHGGWYATLLDSAVGCAVHTIMPVGRATRARTQAQHRQGHLARRCRWCRAEATPCMGRQTATAEGRLYGATTAPYAHASTTCLVFEMPTEKT